MVRRERESRDDFIDTPKPKPAANDVRRTSECSESVPLSKLYEKMTTYKQTMDLIIDSLRKISENRHPGVQGISESIQMSNTRFYDVFLAGSTNPSAETAMNYACTILDILYNNIKIVERQIILQNEVINRQNLQRQLKDEQEIQKTLIAQVKPSEVTPVDTSGSVHRASMDKTYASSVVSSIKKTVEKPELQSGNSGNTKKTPQQQSSHHQATSIQSPTMIQSTKKSALVAQEKSNVIPCMKMSELAEMVKQQGAGSKHDFMIPGDTRNYDSSQYPHHLSSDVPPASNGSCLVS
jgi:hypothetical protein